MYSKERFPLGILLRDEKTSCIYFVIKIEKISKSTIYNLCKIYDHRLDKSTDPFTFHYIVDDEKSNNLTILNADTFINKDGSLVHTLSLIDYTEIDSLCNNKIFMLRYITACRSFMKKNRTYEIFDINVQEGKVTLYTKASSIDKLLTGASHLMYNIYWYNLLENYLPNIPNNLDEKEYIKYITDNCYFCKSAKENG